MWISTGSQLILKYLLLLSNKTLCVLTPAYINDLLQSYLSARDLWSSVKTQLAVTAFNINSYGRRAFSVAVLLLLNSLRQHIRDAGLLDIFIRRLKTVLSRHAFFNWWLRLWCFYILFFFIFSFCSILLWFLNFDFYGSFKFFWTCKLHFWIVGMGAS